MNGRKAKRLRKEAAKKAPLLGRSYTTHPTRGYTMLSPDCARAIYQRSKQP